MVKKKGPSIYPINLVKLTFERNSSNVHIRIRPERVKSFDFQIPEDLEKKLREVERWERDADGKIVARFSKSELNSFFDIKYTINGVVASESLNQSLDYILDIALKSQGYSLIEKCNKPYIIRQ